MTLNRPAPGNLLTGVRTPRIVLYMNTTTAAQVAAAANVTVEQVEKFAQLLAATARDNAGRSALDVAAIAQREEDTRLRNALTRPADLMAIFGGTYDEFRAEAVA